MDPNDSHVSTRGAFSTRFNEYFSREVAQKAAKSLADGVEIEFRIRESDGTVKETFVFTKAGGQNVVRPTPAEDPQLLFNLTPFAAEAILTDPATEIGVIGVNIAKLAVSPDANKRVSIQFKSGFLGLFSKGYFGVLSAGGSQFGAFLASKGLNGMGAIKAVLKKFKSE